MQAKTCTSCEKPHVTTNWYVIEGRHPRAGQIECSAAHEDRIRREVRKTLWQQATDEHIIHFI
jgi:hypothetical protein